MIFLDDDFLGFRYHRLSPFPILNVEEKLVLMIAIITYMYS